MTGGRPSSIRNVEVLKSDGSHFCYLQQLPEKREDHNMDGDMMCGGGWRSSATVTSLGDTCFQLQQGQWTTFSWTLSADYGWHATWRKPNGDLILMGNANTTELVTPLGSTQGFPLEYSA